MNLLVERNGKYFIETSYLHHAEPKRIFIRWPVLETNGCFPELVDGKLSNGMLPEAKHNSSNETLSSYSVYCLYGRYLCVATPKYGESEEVPVAKPARLRPTTETRWQSPYGWQKYDKRKGWVVA